MWHKNAMLERKNATERQGKQSKLVLKNVSSLFALSQCVSCASSSAWCFCTMWLASFKMSFRMARAPRSHLTFHDILQTESLKCTQARKLSKKKKKVWGYRYWRNSSQSLEDAGSGMACLRNLELTLKGVLYTQSPVSIVLKGYWYTTLSVRSSDGYVIPMCSNTGKTAVHGRHFCIF